MKILIAYHSRTGATEKVAEAIKNKLEAEGHEVDVEKVRPLKERGFWRWQFLRLFKSEIAIQPLMIKDVSGYEAIFLGSPNWTKVSLPMKRYLREIKGLRDKDVGVFGTTFFWPYFEWYLFSAYIFIRTFFNSIEIRGGRVTESALFSSFFRRWRVDSNRGGGMINELCKKVLERKFLPRENFLKKKEIEGIQFLIVLFSTIIIFSFIIQLILISLGQEVLDWNQYLALLLIFMLNIYLMSNAIKENRGIFLSKFLSGTSFVLTWTLLILFFPFAAINEVIILGYVLILIFFSFFRDALVVFTMGLVCLLGYFFLYLLYPYPEAFNLIPDILFLTLTLGVIIFVTRNLQNNFIALISAQNEIETARAVLEIRVKARTREIEELNRNLEEKVKERTESLNERIKELEKFTKLSVGRELKMVELKERIKKLGKKNKKTD